MGEKFSKLMIFRLINQHERESVLTYIAAITPEQISSKIITCMHATHSPTLGMFAVRPDRATPRTLPREKD